MLKIFKIKNFKYHLDSMIISIYNFIKNYIFGTLYNKLYIFWNVPEPMKKYYLMSIQNKSNKLNIVNDLQISKEMNKYYLMAIQNDDFRSFQKMNKCHFMATQNNNL